MMPPIFNADDIEIDIAEEEDRQKNRLWNRRPLKLQIVEIGQIASEDANTSTDGEPNIRFWSKIK